MLSAAPSSAAVSDSDAAEEARSFGAEPTTRSVPRTVSGVVPRNIRTVPATRTARPPLASTWVNSSSPPAATASPTPITAAGRNRRAAIGAATATAMLAATPGSIHSPVSSGDTSSTIWRNCTNSMSMPLIATRHSSSAVRAAVNARYRNSPRSTSGSSRRR